jgi:hypothetical protein
MTTKYYAGITVPAAPTDRWRALRYLDGPKKGRAALYGFFPPVDFPGELIDGYRLAPRGRGYTLAPPSGGYMF